MNNAGPVGGGNQEANDQDLLLGYDELLAFFHGVEPLNLWGAVHDDGHNNPAPVTGGVNIPLFRGHETEYLVAVARDSAQLQPHDVQAILTRRDMVLTPLVPVRPQPPEIYMLPASAVSNGFEDGYAWQRTSPHLLTNVGVTIGIVVTSENNGDFPRKVFRDIYRLADQGGFFLVHYRFLLKK